MHTPTLLTIAALLTGLVTAVLYAVWSFNRNIPGLRWWMLSFLTGSVFGLSLLVRERVPEVVAVVVAQVTVTLTAYLCLMASRTYMGRRPFPPVYAVVAISTLVALAVYFTVVVPHPGMRFVLAGLGAGICYLLTAATLAKGGARRVLRVICLRWWRGCTGCFCCSALCCSSWVRRWRPGRQRARAWWRSCRSLWCSRPLWRWCCWRLER